jgi:uncharacterized protein (TIGR00369 family)
MTDAPEGFAPHFRKSPVTDPWEPLHSRRDAGNAVQIGVRIATAHCNSRGMLHGGVIATLADNAMGLSCGAAMDPPPAKGLVKVSLNIDYVGAGRIGQWLLVAPRVIRAGRTLGFVDALITADETIVARASGSFRVLE